VQILNKLLHLWHLVCLILCEQVSKRGCYVSVCFTLKIIKSNKTGIYGSKPHKRERTTYRLYIYKIAYAWMLKFCKPVFYFNKTNYSTEGEFAVIWSLSWGSTTLFEKTDMREHMHVLLISDKSWSMMMCLLTSINQSHPSIRLHLAVYLRSESAHVSRKAFSLRKTRIRQSVLLWRRTRT